MNIIKKILTSFSASTHSDNSTHSNNTTNAPIAVQQNVTGNSIVKKYRIAGVNHYIDNLLKLAIPNPQYSFNKKTIISSNLEGATIYEYNFNPQKTELQPEPENKYDPNAIKVIIDGEHIGYIKAGSCAHVLKILKENRIERITSQISGGKYKMLFCHDDAYSDCEIEKNTTNYSVVVSIHEKKA